MQLFTDDALPVTSNNNEGMATGLYPRLRLPLPETVTENFRKYIKKRIVLRNDRYCYISLDQDEQPPLGTTAPIRGIILLNLDLNSNAPNLISIGKKDAIKEVILRNFARQNKALDIVERIYMIAEDADCYKLTYANPDRAAKLLIKHFN